MCPLSPSLEDKPKYSSSWREANTSSRFPTSFCNCPGPYFTHLLLPMICFFIILAVRGIVHVLLTHPIFWVLKRQRMSSSLTSFIIYLYFLESLDGIDWTVLWRTELISSLSSATSRMRATTADKRLG